MTLSELVVKLGFQVDEKNLKTFSDGIERIKFGVLGLTADLGGSAFALFEMAHGLAEARAETYRAAQEAGLAVEKFSALKFAAGLVHLSAEDLGVGLKFLNRHLFDASKGGAESVKAFAQMGISQQQLAAVGYKADAVLDLMANRFAVMPDGIKKSALAVELFGRSGTRMLPFLSKGAAGLAQMQDVADKLGLVLSKEKAEAAEALEQRFYLLSQILKGLKNTVAGGLVESFNKILDGMIKWLIVNREIIQQNLTGFVKALAANLMFTWRIVKALLDGFSGWIHMLGGVERITRIVLGLFGVLSGALILSGIGRIAMGIYEMAKAWRVMGASALIAQAQALAIPLAIGAAIVAIGLLIDDVVAFFQGRNSVTEKVVNWIKENGTGILTALEDMIQPILDWIDEKVQAILDPIIGLIDKIKSFGSSVSGAVSSGVGSVFDLLGMNPQTAPASSSVSNANSQVQVDAPITVNVPAGTPPGQVGTKVEGGVAKGIEDIFRQTRRATVGGLAY